MEKHSRSEKKNSGEQLSPINQIPNNRKTKSQKEIAETRSPADKTRLNNLTKQLTREIQTIKNESINIYLKELSADSKTDYSVWKATKRLTIRQQINPRKAPGYDLITGEIMN